MHYVLDGLTIFISVLIADLLLDRLHRAARRRRMLHLNSLSHEAKRAKRAAAGSGGGAAVGT